MEQPTGAAVPSHSLRKWECMRSQGVFRSRHATRFVQMNRCGTCVLEQKKSRETGTDTQHRDRDRAERQTQRHSRLQYSSDEEGSDAAVGEVVDLRWYVFDL